MALWANFADRFVALAPEDRIQLVAQHLVEASSALEPTWREKAIIDTLGFIASKYDLRSI